MSARKRRKQSAKNSPPPPEPASRRTPLLAAVVAVAVAAAGAALLTLQPGDQASAPAPTPRASARPAPGLDVLVGQWRRADGGYVLSIRGIGADGRVDAAYFNPRSINVSRAEAAAQGDNLLLFVELRDEGYPGSTYKLRYDRGGKALVGVYYQAALEQSFDVVFTRAK
jgi:hypothetical protein